MGLVDLRTDLKSLRFGKDRVGGGSSNQPYKTRPIPDSLSDTDVTGGPDFLLRGGTLAVRNTVRDASRLTQMFFDLKSPSGLLFTAKQNVLSRSAVATQASGGVLNEGIYLPTSTIAQAVGNPFGIHLNKQGIDPSRRTGPDAGQNGLFELLNITDPLALPVYNDFVKIRQENNKNRLIKFFKDKVDADVQGDKVLYEYNGGPGSDAGVGKTQIKLSSERTGKNNAELRNAGFFSNTDFTNFKNIFTRPRPLKYQGIRILNNPNSVSQLYEKGTGKKLYRGLLNTSNTEDGLRDYNAEKVFVPGLSILTSPIDLNVEVWRFSDIVDADSSKDTPSTPKPDFRKTVAPQGSERIPNSLDYTKFNYEQRVNLGSPGKKKDKSSYVKGAGTALDKINAFPLYKSSNVTNNKVKNDFVKFRIGVIDNEDPSQKTYIHFRAIIKGMSDSYTAKWNGEQFMGRGEELFRYGGFSREISLGWTVAAQSKQELIPMYQKLNYLASVCAPDYSKTGYMRGNLITLTIGGYLYEQTGIMTGINFNIPDESPWEVALPDQSQFSQVGDEGNLIATDPTVKEMPHIIEVTGFNFIPIHDFVPRVQQNKYNNTFSGGSEGVGSGNVLSEHGVERYIALKNGYSENYKGAGASGNIFSEEVQENLENDTLNE